MILRNDCYFCCDDDIVVIFKKSLSIEDTYIYIHR